jgi:hypothetical protein
VRGFTPDGATRERTTRGGQNQHEQTTHTVWNTHVEKWGRHARTFLLLYLLHGCRELCGARVFFVRRQQHGVTSQRNLNQVESPLLEHHLTRLTHHSSTTNHIPSPPLAELVGSVRPHHGCFRSFQRLGAFDRLVGLVQYVCLYACWSVSVHVRVLFELVSASPLLAHLSLCGIPLVLLASGLVCIFAGADLSVPVGAYSMYGLFVFSCCSR